MNARAFRTAVAAIVIVPDFISIVSLLGYRSRRTHRSFSLVLQDDPRQAPSPGFNRKKRNSACLCRTITIFQQKNPLAAGSRLLALWFNVATIRGKSPRVFNLEALLEDERRRITTHRNGDRIRLHADLQLFRGHQRRCGRIRAGPASEQDRKNYGQVPYQLSGGCR